MFVRLLVWIINNKTHDMYINIIIEGFIKRREGWIFISSSNRNATINTVYKGDVGLFNQSQHLQATPHTAPRTVPFSFSPILSSITAQ